MIYLKTIFDAFVIGMVPNEIPVAIDNKYLNIETSLLTQKSLQKFLSPDKYTFDTDQP